VLHSNKSLAVRRPHKETGASQLDCAHDRDSDVELHGSLNFLKASVAASHQVKLKKPEGPPVRKPQLKTLRPQPSPNPGPPKALPKPVHPTARNNRDGSPPATAKRNSIKAQKKLLCPKYLFVPGDKKPAEKKTLFFDLSGLQASKKKTLPASPKTLPALRSPAKQLTKLLSPKSKKPEAKQANRPQSKSKSAKPRKKTRPTANLRKEGSPDMRRTKKSLERMTLPAAEAPAHLKLTKRLQFLSPSRATNRELGSPCSPGLHGSSRSPVNSKQNTLKNFPLLDPFIYNLKFIRSDPNLKKSDKKKSSPKKPRAKKTLVHGGKNKPVEAELHDVTSDCRLQRGSHRHQTPQSFSDSSQEQTSHESQADKPASLLIDHSLPARNYYSIVHRSRKTKKTPAAAADHTAGHVSVNPLERTSTTKEPKPQPKTHLTHTATSKPNFNNKTSTEAVPTDSNLHSSHTSKGVKSKTSNAENALVKISHRRLNQLRIELPEAGAALNPMEGIKKIVQNKTPKEAEKRLEEGKTPPPVPKIDLNSVKKFAKEEYEKWREVTTFIQTIEKKMRGKEAKDIQNDIRKLEFLAEATKKNLREKYLANEVTLSRQASENRSLRLDSKGQQGNSFFERKMAINKSQQSELVDRPTWDALGLEKSDPKRLVGQPDSEEPIEVKLLQSKRGSKDLLEKWVDPSVMVSQRPSMKLSNDTPSNM